MNRKSLLSMLAAGCILLPSAVRATDSLPTTITVNGSVADFAEWATTSDTITIATPLSSVATPQTGSVNLTLYANKAASISAAGGPTNAGVLTSGTNVLTTKYKLTGAGLSSPDGGFKTADTSNFFGVANTYAIDYHATAGSYAVTLTVEMSAPGAAAPASGNYTCDLLLTATF